MRLLLIVLLVAVAVVPAASAQPGTPGGGTYSYGARSDAPAIAIRRGQALPGFTGGPITAADGETVDVFVEDDLLAADPSVRQHWADVLAGLLHGPELAQLTLYIAALPQVTRICGAGSLGCYDPSADSIVAIGQDMDGVTAQSVVTHEYGHHIANTRSNAPWDGVDWGTKRWATYENVCAKSRAGLLVPGDEGRFYTLNPGEAFAEDYRLLNERREGLPESPWEVVDQSLYPDQTALDLLAQDVAAPWTGDTTTTYRGSLGPHATGRGFRISTPLDGTFTATLVVPAKERLALRLVDPATGSVLAAAPPELRAQSISTAVCGQRTIQIQVRRRSGSGAFTLAVSKP